MFQSRSQKIMALAQQNVEVQNKEFDHNVNDNNHNDNNDTNIQVSAKIQEEDLGQLGTNEELIQDYVLLQPLQPTSPSFVEENEQSILASCEENIVDISAGTSKVIDDLLSNEISLNHPDLTDPTVTYDAIGEFPDNDIQPCLDKSPNQVNDENFIKKGFMCYHCNIIFENKKVLRQHISKRHMILELSESDDASSLTKNTEHLLKKRKTDNTNKATTKKEREERKCLRAAGKTYRNVKGKEVNKKERQNFVCTKCFLKCSDKFSESEKDDIFFDFWKMGEDDRCQDRQRQFVANHVVENEPCRRRGNTASRKKRSLHYHLEKHSEHVRVCRLFFLSVLSVTEKFVRTCLEKRSVSGIVSTDQRGKASTVNKIPAWIEEHARQHIQSIPKVESHYCRKSSSKLYLSSQLNLEKLYTLYLEKCREDNSKITTENEKLDSNNKKLLLKPVSKSMYKSYFYSYGNLRFHKPKKDQCSTCNNFKSLTPEEKESKKDEHEKHLKNKEKARELKTKQVKASENTNGKKAVINFDLQAVLECPKGEVSSIFYKRKLAVFDLTIFDLVTKEGTCNLWDETEGNRGANEIGTCVFNYIANHPQTEEFFLMSDSCGGQNLNQYFATALLHAVRCTNCKVIDHVFYEPGHSQQEGDSMHSTIERAAKNVQINVPSEWHVVCQTARKTPKPYNIVYLDHTSFIDWNELAQTNKEKIRYETVTGDLVSWKKIKWFRFLKEKPDSIFFKYEYNDTSFKEIKILKHVGRPSSIDLLPKAYSSRLPITVAKHKDLMDLCKARVIPVYHHKYFEDIPKGDTRCGRKKNVNTTRKSSAGEKEKSKSQKKNKSLCQKKHKVLPSQKKQ